MRGTTDGLNVATGEERGDEVVEGRGRLEGELGKGKATGRGRGGKGGDYLTQGGAGGSKERGIYGIYGIYGIVIIIGSGSGGRCRWHIPTRYSRG